MRKAFGLYDGCEAGYIRTYSGLWLSVFNPTADAICIEDIAHALSHLCRFGGHTDKFYSVGQHSIYCSRMVDKEHKLAASELLQTLIA